MKSEVIDRVADVGSAAARLALGAGRVKEAVAEAVEDGVHAARRALIQGGRAARDWVDDAEHQVRQHPLGTVGASFGIGLGLGALVGVLLARRGHRVE
jgi:ElaB/YqjD/DUF883 family membrane-anchored ribosome-binding protein